MIVLVYFWKIKITSLPSALLHMALDRFALGRNKNITFYKSLGTGRGESFTPRDADVRRWGLLVAIPESKVDEFEVNPTFRFPPSSLIFLPISICKFLS